MFAAEICMALAIYWEARDQPIFGQLAVGQVIMRRVESNRWPNTVCEVVQQKKWTQNKWVCQFSFYCDGKSDRPLEMLAWKRSKAFADIILNIPMIDYSKGSDHYHAHYVSPYWADSLTHQVTIGDHLFYRY